MIITLSESFMRDKPEPEQWVQHAAKSIGCHYRIKWTHERSCRGVLVKTMGSYQAANDVEHDSFIAGIFKLDPDAYVRTALAVYNTKAEFDARLPLEQVRPIVKVSPSRA